MRKITVLYDQTSYTYKWLKPLFWARQELRDLGFAVEYFSYLDYLPSFNRSPESKLEKEKELLKKALNKEFDIVFMAYHHSNSYLGSCTTEERINIVSGIKSHCKTLVWLDTADSTGTCLFDVMPFVDLYFKKQILKDRNLYLENLYGARSFCEYYHKSLGLDDDTITKRNFQPCTKEDLGKIRLSWNVGIGDLFSDKWNLRLHPHGMIEPSWITPSDEKLYDVHFRGSGYSPIAGYQREKCKQLIQTIGGVTHPDVNTMVPHEEYEKEINNSYSILSPFGWGEICGRDFEALVKGAVLIKPSMEHCETYPNIFQPWKTYVPLDWDFKDFDKIMSGAHTREYSNIALEGQNFFRKYRSNEEGKKLFANHLAEEMNQ